VSLRSYNPPPSLQESLRDCLMLVREQQQNLKDSYLIPLSLLRLELRILYLLHCFCPQPSSALETSRYLELNRLLRPSPEQLPALPDNPPPFNKCFPNRL
jgi:hypothetical protein